MWVVLNSKGTFCKGKKGDTKKLKREPNFVIFGGEIGERTENMGEHN